MTVFPGPVATISAVSSVLFIVLLAVGAAAFGGTVIDNAKNLAIQEGELPHRAANSDTVTVVLSYHQQHTIDLLGNGQRITDFTNGRQIQDYIVIYLAQIGKQILHLGRAEQLYRVGRIATCGYHLEGFLFSLIYNYEQILFLVKLQG